jgi:2-polyprenyl-3-methyl-5-hydroxy-6-metoxy-1,4-benzoquinol methylase
MVEVSLVESPLQRAPLSETRHEIGSVDVAALAHRWKTEFGVDVRPTFGSLESFAILRGDDSGILYFDPPMAGDEQLYHALSMHDWYYLDDKWEHRRSLRHLALGAKVLEVGCGRGAFLRRAKLRGCDVMGVELNAGAAQHVREMGIEVSQGDVYDSPVVWDHAFDFVCSFQVLEHVPDPIRFAERLFRFVRTGGELLIAVPNSASFMGRADVLLDLPPHHLTRWDSKALAYLGHAIGADSTRVIAGPLEPLHIDIYLQTCRKRFGRWAVNRFTRPFWKAFLHGGLRFLVPGHSILAVYSRS